MIEQFELQRCSRQCVATGRQLQPGEEIYSALVRTPEGYKRLDFSAEAWQGPPAETIGWWKCRVPDPHARRPNLTPNDILLEIVEQTAEQPQSQALRYVVALLLVRRRVLRIEREYHDENGQQWLELYAPKNDNRYSVAVVNPPADKLAELEDFLEKLVYGQGKADTNQAEKPADRTANTGHLHA